MSPLPPQHPFGSSPYNGHWGRLSWWHREGVAGFDGWRRKASHTHRALPLSPCLHLARQPAVLPTLSCPQPSRQGKGPLVGVARGREKREQKERTLLLKLPQAHESLRESHPVPSKKGSLLCKRIFLTRPQTHFPFSSQSWDWAPASPKEGEMLWA